MVNFEKMVTLKNLFVISMALNLGLLLKVVQEKKDSISSPRFSSFSNFSNFSSSSSYSSEEEDEDDASFSVINLDHGDPTMYQKYWEKVGEKAKVTINGGRFVSYFSDTSSLCWFLEPDLAASIRRLHRAVGNAVVDGRHIVVGSGSSQLILAALYALSNPNSTRPLSVVSAAPYYSSYPQMTGFLKSALFEWEGDAEGFENDGPYVEFVTSPNNPDGSIRRPVVKREGGTVIHDLAYYWPQYTAITEAADHGLMLFTASKSTGHAGTRIGWALVESREVAKRMTKFIELNTIGVSKDSQVRAARILELASEGVVSRNRPGEEEGFFGFARRNMEERSRKIRAAVGGNDRFSLPNSESGFCQLRGGVYETNPAFAWVRCEGEEGVDCEKVFRDLNILTRAGRHFGVDPRYVRVSMLDRDRSFNLFVKRLSLIS